MPVKTLPSPALFAVSDKLIRYGERTLARALVFVQKLMQVNDIYQLLKVQTEFIDAQMEAMTELIRDLHEGTTEGSMHRVKAPTPHAQATLTIKNLAGALAQRHGMGSKQVDELLNSAVASITKHLKSGNRVRIGGFGTFEARFRAARVGRHPATGEWIAINATKTIAFRASRLLTEAVSNGN